MGQIKVEKLAMEKLMAMDVISWDVWEKDVSSFPWSYDKTERCYVTDGKAKVTTSDGEVVDIVAGDVVTFPKGLSCTWEITEKIKKKYEFLPDD